MDMRLGSVVGGYLGTCCGDLVLHHTNGFDCSIHWMVLRRVWGWIDGGIFRSEFYRTA